VAETAGHRPEFVAGTDQLRGHEMTEVVQAGGVQAHVMADPADTSVATFGRSGTDPSGAGQRTKASGTILVPHAPARSSTYARCRRRTPVIELGDGQLRQLDLAQCRAE
jgi:hypothetical protein